MQNKNGPIRASRGARALAVLLGLAGFVWFLWVIPWPRSTLPERTGPALGSVIAWGYQLQRFDARLIPPEIDMIVVDYSRDGTSRRELSAEVVAELRRRDNRPPRIVLAYMSVGEAESYRYYWRSHWAIVRPGWLGRENDKWKGNYPVRFWDAGWQHILMQPRTSVLSRLIEIGSPSQKAYLDRILEAGFDGVYLDRVDAFEHWTTERAGAEGDMMKLVADIARYTKSRRPGFLVVAQNAEELLEHDAYRRSIDGIAKEDLIFGIEGAGKRNSAGDYMKSLQLLRKAKTAGRPVFVVEYIEGADQRREATARMAQAGFALLFATKELNRPPERPQSAPAQSAE